MQIIKLVLLLWPISLTLIYYYWLHKQLHCSFSYIAFIVFLSCRRRLLLQQKAFILVFERYSFYSFKWMNGNLFSRDFASKQQYYNYYFSKISLFVVKYLLFQAVNPKLWKLLLYIWESAHWFSFEMRLTCFSFAFCFLNK